jgi:hypothetical protein
MRTRWQIVMMVGLSLVVGVTQRIRAEDATLRPGDVRVFYYKDSLSVDLKPLKEKPAGRRTRKFTELPLVLNEPVIVEIHGLYFPVVKEGLYRFGSLATRTTRTTILHQKKLWRFLGHLSRLHVHGWRHKQESLVQWTQRARKGRLSITCRNISGFVVHHARLQGYRARPVSVVTLDEWNTYDNGHTLSEIYDPQQNRWILFDGDMGCLFKHQGRYLNLGETVRLYKAGKKAKLDILSPPAYDTYTEPDAEDEFAQYSLLFENMFRNPDVRQIWYARVFQVPFLDGKHSMDSEDIKRLGKRSIRSSQAIPQMKKWQRLSSKEWMDFAYGNEAELAQSVSRKAKP